MPLPKFDAADQQFWKDEATIGGTTPGALTITTNQSLGPKVINGDLTVNPNIQLNVTGPIYVKGVFKLKPGSLLKADPTACSNMGTVIIADNAIRIGEASGTGATIAKTGSNGYMLLVSLSTGIFVELIEPSFGVLLAPNTSVFFNNKDNIYGWTGAIAANFFFMDDRNTITGASPGSFSTCSAGDGSGAWQIIRGTYKFSK